MRRGGVEKKNVMKERSKRKKDYTDDKGDEMRNER